MLYNGKEYTSQEFLDLMQQKDTQLSEQGEKIKKFQEEKDAAAGTGDAGAGDASADAGAAGSGDQAGDADAGDAGAGDAGNQGTGDNTGDAAADGAAGGDAAAADAAPAADAEGKELSEKKQLKEANRQLSERVVLLEEDGRRSNVKLSLEKYRTEGVPPCIVNRAEEIMLADKGSLKSYKFTEDNKSVTKSLSECVMSMLDAIKGVEFSEDTDNGNDGSSDLEGADAGAERHELIKTRMSEDKCDYSVAYHKLLSEGKIEEKKYLNDA